MPSEFNIMQDMVGDVPNSNGAGARMYGMLIKRKKNKKMKPENIGSAAATPAVEWENRSKFELHKAEIANATAELEHRRRLQQISAQGEATSGVERAKAEARADADIRVRGHDSRVTSLDMSEMTDLHVPAFLEHLGPRAFEAKVGGASIKVGPGARSTSELADAEASNARTAIPRQFDGLITPTDPAAIEEEDVRLAPERLAAGTADFERIGPSEVDEPTAIEKATAIMKETRKSAKSGDTED